MGFMFCDLHVSGDINLSIFEQLFYTGFTVSQDLYVFATF